MDENKNKLRQATVNLQQPVPEENDDEIEINIGRIFLEHFWTMLLVALIFAILAAAGTRFLITPKYSSTSMMLVMPKENQDNSTTNYQDLQVGATLTKDYQVLIESRAVLNDVIKELKLDMEYDDLKGCLEITNPTDTRILQIDATATSPKEAQAIANKTAEIASVYIGDKMDVEAPKIIEEGELPTAQSSPSMTKNVAIAFVIGFVLAFAIACINDITNDAIETEEDIQKYLGIPVLASVPDKTQESRSSGKKHKKNKRKKVR